MPIYRFSSIYTRLIHSCSAHLPHLSLVTVLIFFFFLSHSLARSFSFSLSFSLSPSTFLSLSHFLSFLLCSYLLHLSLVFSHSLSLSPHQTTLSPFVSAPFPLPAPRPPRLSRLLPVPSPRDDIHELASDSARLEATRAERAARTDVRTYIYP